MWTVDQARNKCAVSLGLSSHFCVLYRSQNEVDKTMKLLESSNTISVTSTQPKSIRSIHKWHSFRLLVHLKKILAKGPLHSSLKFKKSLRLSCQFLFQISKAGFLPTYPNFSSLSPKLSSIANIQWHKTKIIKWMKNSSGFIISILTSDFWNIQLMQFWINTYTLNIYQLCLEMYKLWKILHLNFMIIYLY